MGDIRFRGCDALTLITTCWAWTGSTPRRTWSTRSDRPVESCSTSCHPPLTSQSRKLRCGPIALTKKYKRLPVTRHQTRPAGRTKETFRLGASWTKEQASLASTWCHAKLPGLGQPEKLGRATTRPRESREKELAGTARGFGKRTGGDWRKLGEKKCLDKREEAQHQQKCKTQQGLKLKCNLNQQGGIYGIWQYAKKIKKILCITASWHSWREIIRSTSPARGPEPDATASPGPPRVSCPAAAAPPATRPGRLRTGSPA